MYFRNLGLRKMSSHKSLKGHVSQDFLKDNMANRLKHCSNLTNSTLPLFINPCKGKCIGETLF